VRKSYGATPVLRGVDLDLRAGEVHVLAGENGAGKSTLIKILSGALPEHEGTIALDGAPVRLTSPSQARALRISTIFQELSLVGAMRVVDNLFLGRELRGPLGVRHAAQREAARRHLDALGLAIDEQAEIDDLPLAERQLVEIAKALLDPEGRPARVVIMDEPSSALGEAEAEALFAQVTRLRAAGCAILYVSHKMEEVYRLADRITVLRDGVVAASAPATELPREALVTAMLGRALAPVEAHDDRVRASDAGSARERLSVRGLTVAGVAGARRDLDEVSFSVSAGEIVAVAGLVGSGASALLHAIFGSLVRPGGAIRGAVAIDGIPYEARSPSASLARGVALLSNDRRGAGILPERSVVENVALSSLGRFSRLGVLRERALRATVLDALRALDVRTPSPDAEIAALSGGNQQKALLARVTLGAPRLLLLDEPTRGVDVGSKHEIHARMRALCAAGASILAMTTETEELLAVADRCVVLCRGRVTAVLDVRGRDPAIVRRRVVAAAMGEQGANEASA
jgi:ABC-type sugar transport system ATPase subunit